MVIARCLPRVRSALQRRRFAIAPGDVPFKRVSARLLGGRRHQDSAISEDILWSSRRKIRKLGLLEPSSVANESALLEHAPRGVMLGMTERVEVHDAHFASYLHNRFENLGRVAVPPRIFG